MQKAGDIMAILVSKATEEQKRSMAKCQIWASTEKEFDWFYDEKEVCLILEGEAVINGDGEDIRIVPGDYVVFPKGLNCTWKVLSPVKKYFYFA